MAVATGLVVAMAAALAIVLATVDLRPIVERWAGEATGRRVAIEALDIRWGLPVALELRGLRVGNAPWGGEPEMVSLERLSAEIDPWSLLGGALEYRRMRGSGLKVVLERGPGRIGNWKMGDGGGGGLIPKNRSQFPTLIDFVLAEGLVIYRDAESGVEIRIGLDRVAVGAEDAASPARLAWQGSYNGTPATLEARTGSFTTMRRTDMPFGIEMTMTATGGDLHFKGGTMRPLDFEGVDGEARASLPDIGRFLTALGAAVDLGAPIEIAGRLRRGTLDWQLDDATGQLAGSPFRGDIALKEGTHDVPDAVEIAGEFERLDLDEVLRRRDDAAPAPFGDLSLDVPAARSTHLAARLGAAAARFQGIEVADLRAELRLLSGEIGIDRLGFDVAQGKVGLQASGRPAGDGAGRWTGLATVDGVRVGELAQHLGVAVDEIAGALSGEIHLEAAGRVVRDALAGLGGHAVLVLREGRIARSLAERVSTDIRALFRDRSGWTPIECFVGLAEIENGTGRIRPVRAVTPDMALRMTGNIAFDRRRLDLLIETDSRGMDLLRLNMPIRVRGSFDDIGIAPLVGPTPTTPANWALDRFPPSAQAIARGNACLR
ncbi:AsmA family protein [Desertibaculum subflavum]|uniref:AsmA family protein n=1 Tax=Desertibaculum subflavum TaxID=2268458 RepID=UPI0013C51754